MLYSYSNPFVLSASNPIPRKLEIWEAVVRATVLGHTNVCAISGGPGLSKTRTIIKVLTASRVPYERVSGTRAALIAALWRLRSGGVVIVDDADHLLIGGGRAQINFIKRFLDGKPGSARVIDNASAKTLARPRNGEPDPLVVPAQFATRATMIWASQHDLSAASPGLKADMDALASRGVVPIQLPSDRLLILEYILDLILHHDLLRTNRPTSLVEAQDVVNYLCEYIYHFTTLGIRTAENAIRYRQLYPGEWIEILEKEREVMPKSSAASPAPPQVLTPNQRKAAGLQPIARPAPRLDWPTGILTKEELATSN